MTSTQFFTVMAGGWTILLALMFWQLFLVRRNPGSSLRIVMLSLGLATSLGTLTQTGSAWMTLVVAALGTMGVVLGGVAQTRWNQKRNM
jgi:hypothetical protein